ncbi:MAG: hypothetical protein IID34_15950 [Planctomycetes bacterium]|nr:hypothetical protein [Planctomycetota bacterium]
MSLEFVTQVRGGQIAIWDLKGAQVGEFAPEDPKLRFKIVRNPDGGDRDFIVLACELYDIDGTLVGTLPTDENGECNPEEVDYGAPLIDANCPPEGLAEFPEEFVRLEELVRVTADSDPYRAEFTYSIEIDYPYVNGPIGYRSHRTILKIHDPTDELVYHEVIATESNPGSFLVIPSDVPGEEVLLVADGTRIVAYFLGETPEE